MENYDYEKVKRELGMIREYCDSIEGTMRSMEHVQPVVRKQDAALTSDEPGSSAAGNSDGHHSLEGFEGWVKSNRETLSEVTDEIDYSDLASGWDFIENVLAMIQRYKGQEAA